MQIRVSRCQTSCGRWKWTESSSSHIFQICSRKVMIRSFPPNIKKFHNTVFCSWAENIETTVDMIVMWLCWMLYECLPWRMRTSWLWTLLLVEEGNRRETWDVVSFVATFSGGTATALIALPELPLLLGNTKLARHTMAMAFCFLPLSLPLQVYNNRKKGPNPNPKPSISPSQICAKISQVISQPNSVASPKPKPTPQNLDSCPGSSNVGLSECQKFSPHWQLPQKFQSIQRTKPYKINQTRTNRKKKT